MFLKKVEGPRAVDLPDGRRLTLADLPPADTSRWIAARKARVVEAVEHGLIPRASAIDRWRLSEEEFDLWHRQFTRHGQAGLRTTWTGRYRQLPREMP